MEQPDLDVLRRCGAESGLVSQRFFWRWQADNAFDIAPSALEESNRGVGSGEDRRCEE
jgi:hypothetical protein